MRFFRQYWGKKISKICNKDGDHEKKIYIISVFSSTSAEASKR